MLVEGRYVKNNGQGFAQRFRSRRKALPNSPIAILSIKPAICHPEISIDGGAHVLRFCGPLLRWLTEFSGHQCKNLIGTKVNAVSTEIFRVIYINGLHPARIRLFAPIQEGGFSMREPRCGVYDHLLIIQNGILDHLITLLKPLPVSRHKIDLPGRPGTKSSDRWTPAMNRQCPYPARCDHALPCASNWFWSLQGSSMARESRML